MILSDVDLKHALTNGDLEVLGLDGLQIGPSSIDLTLDSHLVRYTSERIHLGRTDPDSVDIVMTNECGYMLSPGEFILGCTSQRVRISSAYQGWIQTKGDIARAGIQVHNNDGHLHPGFAGCITLELTNHNNIPVVLYPNIPICQLFLLRLSSPCAQPYCGKYSGHTRPTVYIPSMTQTERR